MACWGKGEEIEDIGGKEEKRNKVEINKVVHLKGKGEIIK